MWGRALSIRVLAVLLPFVLGAWSPSSLAQAAGPTAESTRAAADPAGEPADPAGKLAEPPRKPASPAGAPGGLRSLDAASRRMTDAPQMLWADLRAGRYAQALDRLMALESRWAMDPAYNALLAETALAAKRYAEASLALERLVLLEPRNAGAWLDLAVASEALGDTETARRALDTLDRDFTVPPGIRVVMVSLRARITAAGAAPDRLWVRASLLFGHDSNANGGLAVNSIVLTQSTSDVELPVDPAYLPRPSNLWLGSVDVAGRWATSVGPLEGRLRLSGKTYVSESDYDTRDVAFTAAGQIGRSAAAYWVAEWRHLDLGRGLLTVEIPRVWVNRDLAVEIAGCRPSVGLEFEGRQYNQPQDINDARILWLAGGLYCPLWGGNLSGIARIGDDRGPADRPGGDSRRQEVAALWQGLLASGLELSTGVTLANSHDDQGYSPLIDNGAARDIRRVTARAELAWRLRDGWYAVGWAEHTRQDSNVALFGLRQTVVMTGLRYQSW